LPSAAPPGGQNDVSVVIVTRDRPMDLAACLLSLEPARPNILEVIVIDDDSKTPPRTDESTLPVRILRNKTRSFLSESRNRGAKDAKGEYIMFIDDDNILDGGCLSKLSSSLENDSRGMVASPIICYTSQPTKVWFAGGRIAPVSGIFVTTFRGVETSELPAERYSTEVFHDAFMIKREAFDQVGYFDEVGFPMYLSEADFAARLKERNLGAVVVPGARVWHSIAPLEGTASLLRGVHITEPTRAYFVGRNRLLYMRKHGAPKSFLLHVIVFEPLFISIHVFAMLSGRQRVPLTRLLGPYLRGVLDGLSGRVSWGRKVLQGHPPGQR
jgi:GT2 family glycosyltransferase